MVVIPYESKYENEIFKNPQKVILWFFGPCSCPDYKLTIQNCRLLGRSWRYCKCFEIDVIKDEDTAKALRIAHFATVMMIEAGNVLWSEICPNSIMIEKKMLECLSLEIQNDYQIIKRLLPSSRILNLKELEIPKHNCRVPLELNQSQNNLKDPRVPSIMFLTSGTNPHNPIVSHSQNFFVQHGCKQILSSGGQKQITIPPPLSPTGLSQQQSSLKICNQQVEKKKFDKNLFNLRKNSF